MRPRLRWLLIMGAVALCIAAVPAVAFAAAPYSTPRTIFQDGFEAGQPRLLSYSPTAISGEPASAYWGDTPLLSRTGMYSLWCAWTPHQSEPPTNVAAYRPYTRGRAAVDLNVLADYYSSAVSLWYLMPSVGSSSDSFGISISRLQGGVAQFPSVINDSDIPSTAEWTPRVYALGSGTTASASRQPVRLGVAFFDQIEIEPEGLVGQGPAIDDVVVSAYKYGPVRGFTAGWSMEASGVALAWDTPSRSAISSLDETRPVTYRVWRSLVGSDTWTEITKAQGQTSRSLLDTSVAQARRYEYVVQAWDAGSDYGPQSSPVAVLVPDITPPVTRSDITSASANATITLSPSDYGVGTMAGTWFKVNGGSEQSGTVVPLSGDGVYVIHFRSADTSGNVEQWRQVDVVIDTLPPSTTASAAAGWAKAPAMVTFLATDSASGVDVIRYSLTGSPLPLSIYTAPLSISMHGRTTISYRARDRFGHEEAVRYLSLDVDATSPVTTASVEASAGTVRLRLSAEDEGVGTIAGTWFKVDGGVEQSGTVATAAGDGIHTIKYRSADGVGNTEDWQTFTIGLDGLPPTTTVSAPKGWAKAPALISLAATDAGSGVDTTLYSTDGLEPWRTYSAPVSISAHGRTTFGYRSLDLFGNWETSRYITVDVDGRAPVTTATVSVDGSTATVSLSAGDDGVGIVAGTRFSVDGGAEASGTTALVIGEGVHKVRYRSEDAVGNLEEWRERTVMIDVTAPSTTASAPVSWVRPPAVVSLTATDAVSGVATTTFSVGGTEPWGTFSGPLVLTEDGETHVAFRSSDKLGNLEDVREVTVRVDGTAPESTVSVEPTSGGATVHVSAQDSGVGALSGTWLRLDGAAQEQSATTVFAAPGLHTIEYRSADSLGNTEAWQSYSFIVPHVLSIEMTASAGTVRYPAKITLRGSLLDASRSAVAGRALVYEYSYDGVAWSKLATATVSGNDYVWTTTPSRLTYYRLVFPESSADVLHPAVTGSALPVTVTLSMSTPSVSSSTTYRYRTLKVSALIRPKHTSGIKFRFYRLEGSKWVLRKTVSAKYSTYNSTTTKVYCSTSLSTRGKWRVRVYHSADAHPAQYSPYRSITVR